MPETKTAVVAHHSPDKSLALSHDVEKAFRELLEEATPQNTRLAMKKDMSYIEAWYRERFSQEPTLPYPPGVLVTFITDHFALPKGDTPAKYNMPAHVEKALIDSGKKTKPGPHRPKTIQRRLSTLSRIHEAHGYKTPAKHAAVTEALAGMRKVATRSGLNDQAYIPNPAVRDVIEALLGTCGTDIRGQRDRAIISLGFGSGGRRPSEIARLEIKHVKQHADGNFTYVLPYSKRRKEAKEKPVKGAAAAYLRIWLDRMQKMGVTEGPLFRGVLPNGKLNEGISARTISRIVAERARQACLPGDWSAKSLRSGFLTQCADSGVSMQEAIDLSDHATIAGAEPYFAASDALKNKAGDLL
jgi:site-specific recombinase XerC